MDQEDVDEGWRIVQMPVEMCPEKSEIKKKWKECLEGRNMNKNSETKN
jgi:hypothetical protein